MGIVSAGAIGFQERLEGSCATKAREGVPTGKGELVGKGGLVLEWE